MDTGKNILLGILKCPACENFELAFEKGKIICPKCSEEFPIEKGVPEMLFEDKSVSKNSEVHNVFKTEFNYIDHYQKDAIEHDYFKEKKGAVKHNERRIREYIINQVPKKNGLILDVGCGSAWVAKSFCPKNYQVVSFDISLKNTSEALERYPFSNHAAVAGDVFSPPFKPESFEIIIASEILEHVTQPTQFIKTLATLLKPGGNLIITTPYKEKIEYSLCVHCNKPTPKSAHLHSFDENILLSFFKNEGIKKPEFYKFGNKALIHLRTHVILKYTGFILWRMIDKLGNLFYNHPISILIKWQKPLN